MRYLVGLIFVLVLVGCQSRQSPSPVVAKIGEYTITKEEFDEAYKNSTYSVQDSPEARQAFLNNMINQKLIFLDAQAKGLDQDRTFLKMVENFWQQSLVTINLRNKTKEGGNLDKWLEYLKSKATVEIHQEALK
jgi:hypothetical protein